MSPAGIYDVESAFTCNPRTLSTGERAVAGDGVEYQLTEHTLPDIVVMAMVVVEEPETVFSGAKQVCEKAPVFPCNFFNPLDIGPHQLAPGFGEYFVLSGCPVRRR
jgi:hypothetical protein